MRCLLVIALCGVIAAANATQAVAQVAEVDTPSRPIVVVTGIEGDTISSVTVRHIRRAIRRAEDVRAECLVISLDTPGGLVTATRDIVKDILASRVPVVIYVAPTGAQAASAGGFITLSAHVAVMSPATTIGAMHPVAVGGLPIPSMPEEPSNGQQPPDDTAPDDDGGAGQPARTRSPVEEKSVNNTAAWARGLAVQRGRNGDWAERAVMDSIVATETEALEAGVIDFLASDLQELLETLDGREITLFQGTKTLQTKGAVVERVEMWWGDQTLSALANPNVAFLLLIFGFYGILFELYSPGWGVGGTLGIVCLVLAFFGLSVLPINYVGLLLIAVALGMFVAEAFVVSYGALVIGGCVCLVIGGLMLVDSPVGFARVSLAVVVPIAAATACIAVMLIGAIVKLHRSKVLTGTEGLVGLFAETVEAFEARDGEFAGSVRIHGEFWNATCAEQVPVGAKVRVEARDGLLLRVTPVTGSASAADPSSTPLASTT